MRYLRYLALLSVLMLPLSYSQAQVSVGVGVGGGYVAGPPVCSYGYYDTTLTRAHLTAITDLAGSWAECLSAPGRGITDTGAAADGVRVGVGVMATMAADGVTDTAITVDAAMHGAQWPGSMAARPAGFMAAQWPTEVAADSTVAAVVVDTPAVGMAVADTGNRG